MGCNLIWYDDDITTAVYSFWSGVYDYEGNMLASLILRKYLLSPSICKF